MAQISPLRQRMIEDLTIRNLSPETQRSYVHHVAKFSRFFGRSPDQLGYEEVRAYQAHLVGRRVSWGALNQTVCALRFFYGVTLGRSELPERIAYARTPRKLPVVLSADEVVGLPLFSAASAREESVVAELDEPIVSLRPMAAGSEVVEDYSHLGLTLRDHPVSFLRRDLARRRMVTCAVAMASRDGRWVEAAGLVLVRQRPGSAKGVMFITLEDESGIANLVVWPKVFELNRRTILSAGMIAVRGRIQREGEVVHLVVQRLTDLSGELANVGEMERPFQMRHGRGDEFHHGSSTPDPRGLPSKGLRTRDIYVRDLHIDTIKVKTRDFR